MFKNYTGETCIVVYNSINRIKPSSAFPLGWRPKCNAREIVGHWFNNPR